MSESGQVVGEVVAPPWPSPDLLADDYRIRVQAFNDRQQSDWSDVQIVRVVAGSGAVAPHSDSAGHLASRSANGKPAAASPLWLTIGAVALIVLGLAVALVCYGPAAYERIVGNPSGPAAPPTVAPTPRAPTSAPGSGNATRGTAIIPPPSPTAGGTPPALSGAGPAKAEATVLRPTIVDDFHSAAATEVAGKAGATLTPRLAPTSTPPPPAAAPTRGTTVTRTVTPTPSTPTSAVTPTPALTPR
ncbi:MAG: hypothetical protein HYY04_18465 [Chloroflexi bacterium]|nr:hypothetical protein [Chloroflexota bacterium]